MGAYSTLYRFESRVQRVALMSVSNAVGSGALEGVANQLRELAGRGHDLNVAQVHFAGFDEMASRLGDRWPLERSRVLDIAHEFIGERMGVEDLMLRAVDGFILVYAETDPARAEAHSEKVMAELNARLLEMVEAEPPCQAEVEHQQLSLAELMQSVVSMTSALAPEELGDAAQLSRMEWRYQPVWDVRRQAIATYSMAAYDRAAGTRISGYRFDAPAADFDLAEIDAMGLEESEVALRRMMRGGEKFLLAASLHFSTMTRPASRNRMFRLLNEFDPELARYRVLRLAGVPKGFPRMYLEEIFSGLKGRGSKIAVSMAWDDPDPRNILSQSPWAIGVELTADVLNGEDAPSERTVLANIKKVADVARGAGVQFYFKGPVYKRFVAGLVEARADSIASELVWPPLAAPQGPQKWPAEMLAA